MGSFAQAARRQGYLKDFGINLQSIAKMLNDRKLQREMMLRAQGDKRRKDRQTTAFNSAEDFYANNIKSTYNKAAEDQAITPFESAEINQGLYDFRKNMSKYSMVDKERLSSSDKAMSDLAKSLGVVVDKPEVKQTPVQYTEEWLKTKNKYDKEMVDYKNQKDKLTKDSDKKTEQTIDRSKLRGEIAQGIRKIKNIKQQGYKETNEPVKNSKGEIVYGANRKVITENGTMTFSSAEDVTRYKEAIKTEYLPKMQELITKAGLDGALPIIRNGISRGLKAEEAIKKFAEANNLPADDVQDLTNWFTLLGL